MAAMRKMIQTGLAPSTAPVSGAVLADGVLYTAQIPKLADGSIEKGDIRAQTRQMLRNLETTVRAAGGTMDDVQQVIIYIVDQADFAGMNEVYREFFSEPWPNRATIIAAGLAVPGMKVEAIAYAHIGRS